MDLGYIGLGKMGKNMVTRLLVKKHRVSVFDVNQSAVRVLTRKGAQGGESIKEMLDNLPKKNRVIWIMVPYKFVDSVLDELTPLLKRGDLVIDGGNSPYQDSIRRAKKLKTRGIGFLDVGVSGGPKGALNGACLMIGGEKKDYDRLSKFWKDLAVKDGYGYMGGSGAGHFVKMVHNGIEYGMMQAMAEGFDIMKHSRGFDIDLESVAKVYNHSSVIESRLMGWLHSAFKKHGTDLKPVTGRAIGTGEGKWTVNAAHCLGRIDKVIHESIKARYRSAKKPSFQGKIIMAIRNQFGGHSIKDEK